MWPDAGGEVWSSGIAPLYAGAPAAARQDARLHELLALVDALRLGRPREGRLAARLLRQYPPFADVADAG